MKEKRHFDNVMFMLLLTVVVIIAIISISFVIIINGASWINVESNDILNKILSTNFGRKLIIYYIICIIISVVVAILFSKVQIKPLRDLQEGMENLSSGKFDTRLSVNKFVPYEFKSLVRNFNITAKELQSTELFRKDFINNFSHEFKTPIVSICGFARLLQNKSITREEREEYLDIIIRESNRLGELSGNVLMLCKIENQSTLGDIETFNIAEQIRESIIMLESKWKIKKIKFDINFDKTNYRGNCELLGHVWINIIDNAIKFSPKNATVKIDLHKDSNNIVFSVTDYGNGMDSETLDRIFEKFYQGDCSHTTKGNGIGLSLVKSIVEIHKGTINVISEPDIGTTFTVVLPFSE